MVLKNLLPINQLPTISYLPSGASFLSQLGMSIYTFAFMKFNEDY